MESLQDYRAEAQKHEDIFQQVLRDLRENKDTRPGGIFIPQDLDTDASIEDIWKKYSEGVRRGIFTILNFERPNKETVYLSFQDVAPMSGGGAKLKYSIDEDNKIHFVKHD